MDVMNSSAFKAERKHCFCDSVLHTNSYFTRNEDNVKYMKVYITKKRFKMNSSIKQ